MQKREGTRWEAGLCLWKVNLEWNFNCFIVFSFTFPIRLFDFLWCLDWRKWGVPVYFYGSRLGSWTDRETPRTMKKFPKYMQNLQFNDKITWNTIFLLSLCQHARKLNPCTMIAELRNEKSLNNLSYILKYN